MNTFEHTSGCGATITGIDLAQLSQVEADEINQLLAEHGVLVFREQNLTEADHVNLARRLGDIVLNPFFQPNARHPEIALVAKSEQQTMNIGGGWHTDHSYENEPAKGSILVAREVPKQGGDTRFAHLGRAYQSLPQHLKEEIATLKATHTNEHIYGKGGYYSGTDQAANIGGVDEVGSAIHPVVIAHPETGKPILYVNPAHVVGIVGYSQVASRDLLEVLYDHVIASGYIHDHRWERGSVAIWDNRVTWHFANNDYQGEARLMHRITLNGSRLKGCGNHDKE